MAKRLTINVGFITNSSSAVHWFPKELLEEPEVKTFMDAYGLNEGYVGTEMWGRSTCETVALTKAQKQEVKNKLGAEPEYGGASIVDRIDPDSDKDFVVIYGDEHCSVTSELSRLLSDAASKRGLVCPCDDYN